MDGSFPLVMMKAIFTYTVQTRELPKSILLTINPHLMLNGTMINSF